MPPRAFETKSANGKFAARVEPGDSRNQRPTLEMFNVEGGKRISQWKINLANELRPYEVRISGDGQYAVTLDEYGRLGHNDVVGIYSRAGLFKNYSLKDFASAALAKSHGIGLLFPESVSSRFWRTSSFSSLNGTGADARFGIWLPWAEQWYVWKLADGSMEKLSGEALKKWNEMGLRWARAQLEQPDVQKDGAKEKESERNFGDQISACRFLAFAKDPADRKLLEKLLDDGETEMRMRADYGLAILDGGGWRRVNEVKRGLFDVEQERDWLGHYRLGGVRIVMKLPERRPTEELKVSYYLFDGDVKRDALPTTAPLVHAILERPQVSPIDFAIHSLKPRRYWIKVEWYGTGRGRTPDGERADGELLYPFVPEAGIESTKGDIFEIIPGKVIEVKLNRDTPAAKR